ncbi:hypothetical protein GW17_00055722 [Ensete ventricosum]|nr:hypothetical protein GW17_00055722 [Ensete ventricosum]
MRTARYRAVPSKIDRRRPIEEEIDRRWSIEEEKGKKKRKRKKKKRGRKNTSPARHPRPPAVVARGSPARGRRPWVTRGRFSRARRRSLSPRGETDRGDSRTGTDNMSVHRYRLYLKIIKHNPVNQ